MTGRGGIPRGALERRLMGRITPDQHDLIEQFLAATGVRVVPGPHGTWTTYDGVREPDGTWFPSGRDLGPLLRRIEARLRRSRDRPG